jgi:hypothetical protein
VEGLAGAAHALLARAQGAEVLWVGWGGRCRLSGSVRGMNQEPPPSAIRTRKSSSAHPITTGRWVDQNMWLKAKSGDTCSYLGRLGHHVRAELCVEGTKEGRLVASV